jgi:hypothetical protein
MTKYYIEISNDQLVPKPIDTEDTEMVFDLETNGITLYDTIEECEDAIKEQEEL